MELIELKNPSSTAKQLKNNLAVDKADKSMGNNLKKDTLPIAFPYRNWTQPDFYQGPKFNFIKESTPNMPNNTKHLENRKKQQD